MEAVPASAKDYNQATEQKCDNYIIFFNLVVIKLLLFLFFDHHTESRRETRPSYPAGRTGGGSMEAVPAGAEELQ